MFEYALKSVDRQKPTEVKRNTPWWQVSPGTHMVHVPRGKNKLERDFQILTGV